MPVRIDRRSLIAGGSALALGGLTSRASRAQAANTIRIGVLNDQSGLYRDISGPTSVACVRQAVQDAGSHGFNVEVLVADHQNGPMSASTSPGNGSTATAST